MKRHLTQISFQRLKEVLDYNPETGDFTWKISTGRVSVGTKAGTRKGHGYIQIRIDSVIYLASRLAWFWMTEKWPIDEIDHVNGIRDDNRFANLREANRDQNSRNTTSYGGITGVSGVYLEKTTGRYYAQIRVGSGRRICLGTYDTVEQAAAARKIAVEKYHGGFAGRHKH
jgi:hypothetical protein